MNKRQARSLNAYRGALAFLEEGRTPKDAEFPDIRARLRDTVKTIERVAANQQQIGGRLVGAARQQLDEIRSNHMLPLADVTRRHFIGEPSVLAALRVPHKKAKTDEILGASELMTKTLQSYRRFLTAERVDTRRIGLLREETRQVKKLFNAANARIPTRTLATDQLKPLFASATLDLKALDSMMRRSCSSHELRNWRIVSRIGKQLGRPRKKRRPPPLE